MFNPVRAIKDGGYKIADALGSFTGKLGWPKRLDQKDKSFVGGAVATALGVGLLVAGIQIAAPALLLGAFLGWFSILPPLGLQFLAVGAAAASGSVLGYGMIDGADRHCGFKTAVVKRVNKVFDKLDAGIDKAVRVFSRTKAPSATDHSAAPAPEAPSNFSAQKAGPSFAQVAAPAQPAPPVPAQPGPAAKPALTA